MLVQFNAGLPQKRTAWIDGWKSFICVVDMRNDDYPPTDAVLREPKPKSNSLLTFLFGLFDVLLLVLGVWLVSLPVQNWILTRSATLVADLLSGSIIMEWAESAPVGIRERNLTKLTNWAAERGYAVAQRRMGLKLKYGIGTEKQPEESVRWLFRAIEQDDVPSMSELAEAYYYGAGIEKDLGKAAILYEVAAKKENSLGECGYGMMLAEGIAIRQDYVEALKYMKKSLEQDESCLVRLAEFYEKGLAGKKFIGEAVPLYEKAANGGYRGYKFAMTALASMYEMGRGTEENNAKAIEWFRRADAQDDLARLEDLEAQKNLWKEMQEWLDKHVESATSEHATAFLMWLHKAASQGDPESEYLTGQLYDKGKMVAQDRNAALIWMRKAADRGHSGANLWIAKALEEGKLLPRDIDAAVRHYNVSAKAGNPEAQYVLGSRYVNRPDATRNGIDAHAWLNLAAASGHEEAAKLRDHLAESLTSDQILEAQKLARVRQKEQESDGAGLSK